MSNGGAEVPETAERDSLRFGPVTVLLGDGGGRYPDGNSLLVRGTKESVLIDPAVGLVDRPRTLPQIDRVLLSHCHEDHIAGLGLFPTVPVHVHAADAVGLRDLRGMLEIYGYPESVESVFTPLLLDQFHYAPRDDVRGFGDGAVFDLGGARIEVLHTPGHTRGHCCFSITWEEAGALRRLVYLGDIELTGFGPYYGDAWSDLADFEGTLAGVRKIEADWYATFHHIGVLESRGAFLERLDLFERRIGEREARLLEYLGEPRTLDEIVAHRIVFRPGVDLPHVDPVERRSASLHLERLIRGGDVRQPSSSTYLRTA